MIPSSKQSDASQLRAEHAGLPVPVALGHPVSAMRHAGVRYLSAVKLRAPSVPQLVRNRAKQRGSSAYK